MIPLVRKYLDEAKAAGEDEPEVCFRIAKTAGGIAGRIRTMTSLAAVPPPPHEHPLAPHDTGANWVCDGCGQSFGDGSQRHRCSKGCDFDLCATCDSKLRVLAAYNLLNSDSGILGDVSNLYVTARAGRTENRTPTIIHNLNPIWISDTSSSTWWVELARGPWKS